MDYLLTVQGRTGTEGAGGQVRDSWKTTNKGRRHRGPKMWCALKTRGNRAQPAELLSRIFGPGGKDRFAIEKWQAVGLETWAGVPGGEQLILQEGDRKA